jgi:hypothetical protein
MCASVCGGQLGAAAGEGGADDPQDDHQGAGGQQLEAHITWVATIVSHLILRRRAERDGTPMPVKGRGFPYVNYLRPTGSSAARP